MPTIEITDEQAAALARGESLTLEPQTERRWIVEFGNGNAFDVLSRAKPVVGKWFTAKGDCRLVRKGPHTSELGHVQCATGGKVVSFVEIPRTR